MTLIFNKIVFYYYCSDTKKKLFILIYSRDIFADYVFYNI